MKQTIKTLHELEEARQALRLSEMPANKKASEAEKLGDYRYALKLWEQVVHESSKNSISRRYARLRQMFCQSAVEKNYKRPELVHLWVI